MRAAVYTRVSTAQQAEEDKVSLSSQLEDITVYCVAKGKELDWIVMKALEKERTRRYESVGAFARDIECYLNSEPVSAAAPSVIYQFRKFARRHRAAMMMTAALAAALVIGTVVEHPTSGSRHPS